MSEQSMKNKFSLSLVAEKVYAELAARPRSVVQLSRDLDLAPWQIFRAVHELNQLGKAAYLPSRGYWMVTD
jgi:DNA-binding IclR family transcriptional regulator